MFSFGPRRPCNIRESRPATRSPWCDRIPFLPNFFFGGGGGGGGGHLLSVPSPPKWYTGGSQPISAPSLPFSAFFIGRARVRSRPVLPGLFATTRASPVRSPGRDPPDVRLRLLADQHDRLCRCGSPVRRRRSGPRERGLVSPASRSPFPPGKGFLHAVTGNSSSWHEDPLMAGLARTLRFARLDHEMRAVIPGYPHWYLWMLGVEPECREKKGFGSSLLKSLSLRADVPPRHAISRRISPRACAFTGDTAKSGRLGRICCRSVNLRLLVHETMNRARCRMSTLTPKLLSHTSVSLDQWEILHDFRMGREVPVLS